MAVSRDGALKIMPRDFFDPTPEQQNVVLIDGSTLRQAERLIESCEACNPEGAEIPFDNVLDSSYPIRSQRDGLHSGSTGEVPELPSRDSGKDFD